MRMQRWVALSRATVQAEFPGAELLHGFSVFDLASTADAARAPRAAEPWLHRGVEGARPTSWPGLPLSSVWTQLSYWESSTTTGPLLRAITPSLAIWSLGRKPWR